ncbi:MAG: DNA translocase FtsK 4TM domain-containing protein, partial [Amphiplicatus sp.]|nr:DNA translocase FtsK 4TM domain-containing protein [Amphiplicatus sp.]
TFSISDPSFDTATPREVGNWAGLTGAIVADLALQLFGGAALLFIAPLAIWGGAAIWSGEPEETPRMF